MGMGRRGPRGSRRGIGTWRTRTPSPASRPAVPRHRSWSSALRFGLRAALGGEPNQRAGSSWEDLHAGELHARPAPTTLVPPPIPEDLMRQLTGLDTSFLRLESRSTYGHVSGLTIYDPSTT